ncbi:uncharacterized protein LOC114946183 [Nylanderia fulva]|uniref:uncharacterized protein LOC114928927 n=2 Tax=Nylanderia fulva TaxID=613905 RepID=UPI0010FAEB64|nr:uncharacterized protein LOC114928927 [Nylanderia fulva]XP_029156262.1 uncharacterized protein LOC114929058 [Nylanderia fulva]XP_029156990.1 uncharacterized protein LOC114929582 [Nylanderia fulva]XP_029166938.1 uncharacterized protein LOC114937590 [Nylanderia fulva]XP_029168803.1 uncharacterized protein LOC114938858 [Nylanderia fulva]XP_029178442.1 uncharacterized protein LOC114946183 [Nylanderia fulva]
MAELRNLLIAQTDKIDQLKRVLINFKKLAKANVTLPKTQGRLEKVHTLWASCQELHLKLLQTTTKEDQKTMSYFLDEEFLEAEEIYDETVDYLRETISRFTDRQPVTLDRSTDSSVRDNTHANFHLPRITLPKFSGRFLEWESFKSTFESLVAKNDALSNTQKFHYLKTSIIGDAALKINNLRISDANYESAWQLLVDEYDDRLTLIQSHLHAFMNLPIMRNENVIELSKLRDTVAASIAALHNLDRPVDQWDDILVYVVSQKFSVKTKSEWNLKVSSSHAIPSYKDIHEFLALRIRGLSDFTDVAKIAAISKNDKPRSSVNNVSAIKCIHCSGNHFISKCETFLSKSATQRNSIARQNRICFLCLKPGHMSPKCTSKQRCSHCRRPHHSLLHSANHQASADDDKPESNKTGAATIAKTDTSCVLEKAAVASVQTVKPPSVTTPTVLLATAWVDVHTAEGRCFKVRALLDQGSNFSFISEALCQTMRAKRQRADLQIKGFGEKFTGSAKSRVSLRLTHCDKSDPTFPFTAYVFQRITSYAASRIQPVESWPHLKGLSLADPDPSSNHQIHMLIGADIYGSLLMRDLRQGPLGTPTAQLTALGWIISGPTGKEQRASTEAAVLNCVLSQDVDSLLQQFWMDEEISSPTPLTDEEENCERHFVRTHYRHSDGRYVVRLPFKSAPPIEIGESLSIARSLYGRMENRLRNRSELGSQYNEFLAEYESLGHMTRVDELEQTEYLPVYIPHHPVIREASCTTKLRVVFNASCKTRNGTTLNDHLLIGPKLQQDLPAVLSRWRRWRHVYTADIAKMFRQIRVHPKDIDYQRILWRPTEDATIQHYRLLTVTYGLAPAPYLAMRVLKQLALDEGVNYPAAVPILNESIYVDDTLFGANDIQTLTDTRDQVISLMKSGGFQLRKWASNTIELLKDFSTDKSDVTDHLILNNESLKVLGLSWIPAEDSFRLVVNSTIPIAPTKRSILSFVAKLYDPLGWAAPVVIVAKIVLQELWLLHCDWDSPLPDEVKQRWSDFVSEFNKLKEIRIPRWTGQHPDNLAIEVHGFADASNRAFAAVVYLRVLHSLTDYEISLIAAKTKVAPVKTVSIPRLELNAIVLLSRLVKWILNSLNLSDAPIYCWTDSTITLAWLRQHPSKWTTYVANRVAEVQNNLPSARWEHVPSKDNPADCASRGLLASELPTHPLWWTGPHWLKGPSTSWPTHDVAIPLSSDTILKISSEIKRSPVLHMEGSEEWDLMYKFSSWPKLVRVTAYIYRFLSLLVKKGKDKIRTASSLSVDELNQAELFWLSYAQARSFGCDIASLKKDRTVTKKSPLRTLNPFLGEDSLLRLGGRLKNAALTFEEQHPIIVPQGQIASLLVAHAHKSTLHGGVQLVLRTLRQRYWILGSRNAVKNHVRRCVVCTRHSAKLSSQLMGDLPSPRVNPSSPFTHTGVDYAGPFLITPFVGKGQKARKNWIALFICLVTKAIHLELVDDYSSAGFISAFRRFAGRRGLPKKLYSDNGTNFHGADRELQNAFEALMKDASLQADLANDRIEWHFIPSAAPHFGGLWEAGVKSLKSHLKRVAGSRTLSQAEFATLLCQIEACLNSRPIAALSDDPNDLSALTPGHFLIGRPMVSVPEESVLAINPNRLSRWQLLNSMKEQIWRAWSLDYLHTLQQRNKWTDKSPCYRVGELALLKNPLLPPSKWELARITQIHPGSDGLVRVVTMQTARSVLKRPITSLCRLPINCNTV